MGNEGREGERDAHDAENGHMRRPAFCEARPGGHGLTLVELLMTTAMFAAVAAVAAYLFVAVARIWSSREARAAAEIELDFRMQEIVRDLREASDVQSLPGTNEVRYTRDGTDYYIYYLYNPGDGYPPAFNQDAYELKKTLLAGGIDGGFGYGDGKIFIRQALPPPASELSAADNMVTLDITVERDGERLRSRTRVRPRNL